MSVTLEVFNPVASDEDIVQIAATATLKKLNGARLGILNNTKPGAYMLQPFVEQELKKRIQDVQVKTWTIPFATPQSAKDPMLQEISRYADGVVALVGD